MSEEILDPVKKFDEQHKRECENDRIRDLILTAVTVLSVHEKWCSRPIINGYSPTRENELVDYAIDFLIEQFRSNKQGVIR